ncbi:hypothetical protein [Parapedobacter sp. DT-150]|uniref:hypothetical protein n=1 Tax=Parapedobacter sp. DT-150 TaxID=3396162 RepID=UPI003F1CF59F
MKRKIELGDVFELETKKGMKAYFQCAEIPRDDRYLELIKIFYDLYPKRPGKIDVIVNRPFFFNEFPLKAALRRKIAEKIGNQPLPAGFKPPRYFRTENTFGPGWQIVDSETCQRQTVIELSEEHKKLSPWGSMNDTLILELLEKGWTLENWTLTNRFAG